MIIKSVNYQAACERCGWHGKQHSTAESHQAMIEAARDGEQHDKFMCQVTE